MDTLGYKNPVFVLLPFRLWPKLALLSARVGRHSRGRRVLFPSTLLSEEEAQAPYPRFLLGTRPPASTNIVSALSRSRSGGGGFFSSSGTNSVTTGITAWAIHAAGC